MSNVTLITIKNSTLEVTTDHWRIIEKKVNNIKKTREKQESETEQKIKKQIYKKYETYLDAGYIVIDHNNKTILNNQVAFPIQKVRKNKKYEIKNNF